MVFLLSRVKTKNLDTLYLAYPRENNNQYEKETIILLSSLT